MLIKYRVSSGIAELTEVEIVRETEKCVYIQGLYGNPGNITRQFKQNSWATYYDTWTDAQNALRGIADRKLTNALKNLRYAEDFSTQVANLSPPEAPTDAS